MAFIERTLVLEARAVVVTIGSTIAFCPVTTVTTIAYVITGIMSFTTAAPTARREASIIAEVR